MIIIQRVQFCNNLLITCLNVYCSVTLRIWKLTLKCFSGCYLARTLDIDILPQKFIFAIFYRYFLYDIFSDLENLKTELKFFTEEDLEQAIRRVKIKFPILYLCNITVQDFNILKLWLLDAAEFMVFNIAAIYAKIYG